MEKKTFLLTNYISKYDTEHIKDMQQFLFNKGVLSKDYVDDGLMLLYNRYNNDKKAPLELECRSVVIDRNTFEIKNYSIISPIYNQDAVKYLIMNQDIKKEYFTCYEGSLLSMFYHNNSWYFSSRRNLMNISEENTNPHFQMFKSVIEQDNFNINTFSEHLNKDFTYHFVLIHHQNKNIVNYETQFGKEYKKLCFIFARNKNTNEEVNAEDMDTLFLSDNIFLPQRLQNEIDFDKMNSEDITLEPKDEGIIIKTDDRILKLQNIQYQFYKAIGHEENLYRGFLHLYQNNKLKKYFENNSNTQKYSKIVNPLKTDESYDTMGMIDAVFKVITKELFELFIVLYDLNTGNQSNKDIYKILPNEYKLMMFKIRKLFFINKKNNVDPLLSMKNIYFYLKSVDINVLEKFMRVRKLMINLIRKEKNNPDIIKFSKTINIERKVLNKLCAIYTSKMFPEIMPDDIIN
jgi:hypothetical protein